MSRQYLMCRPTHFAVEYAINPWMNPDAPMDLDRAIAQWESLVETHRNLGHSVQLIDPVPGLPDMVFAANGGTVIDGTALGVAFTHPERADEGPAYLEWFARAGFRTQEPKAINEGEGDMLLTADFILAGTGFRTATAAHDEAQELFGRPVITLQLIDPRFYHLDTALCVLHRDAADPRPQVAYLPEAFSEGSRRVLERLFPNAIRAGIADAVVLGLNVVSDGTHIVMPMQATALAEQLTEAGFTPVPVDLSELLLAGGGPKCCTLELRSE